MNSQHYDAIVVGLGGVGSFALRALSKEKSSGSHRRYLGIELGSLLSQRQQSFPPSNGHSTITPPSEDIPAGFSSRGLTRIYRRAYFEHANYVPWIEHSLNVFREMEVTCGLSLMKECGVLLIEPCLETDGRKSTHKFQSKQSSSTTQLPPLVAASLNSAHLHKVPVELLNSDQLQNKFPQFKYGTKNCMVGLLEPGGGFLRPERIMKAALDEAMSSGNVDVVDRTTVSNFKDLENKDIVELQLSQRNNSIGTMKVTTNKLLICMGAWTGSLIPLWNRFLHPLRLMQSWIKTNEANEGPSPNMFGSASMPCFIYISPDWPEPFYGVPCDDNADEISGSSSTRSAWLKVGIHKQDISKSNHLSIDDHQSSVASPEEILELKHIVPLCISEAAWGGNDDPTLSKLVQFVETKPCMYTMTPDKHFVIGEVSRNIFGVAGLSGHGFKMTPSLGQMMADFACGRDVTSNWKTEFCSPNRFE